MLADRFGKNTHQQVKAKILERLGEWTEMFSKDPDLGIMAQAYNKLKSQSKSLELCCQITSIRSAHVQARSKPSSTI